MSNLKIFSGTIHPGFARDVCKELGVELSDITIKRFPDTEVYVKIGKTVRGADVFVIQPTSRPVNESLMELMIIIDALKRSSVSRINVVIPYFGYSRQDRRATAREPITAKLVVNLLTRAGADRVVAVDLHSPQTVGFFDIDIDHFEAYPLFVKYLKDKGYATEDIVAVASDSGFVKKARNFAKLLECPLAIIDKRRPYHSKSEVVNVIGEVEGKICILLDDMIDTGGTITSAAEALKKNGAKEVIICATHGVLSGDAAKKLDRCPATEIVLTDTLPIPEEKKISKIKIISITEMMAKVIARIHSNDSLGELFSWEEKVNVGTKRED